MEVKKLKKSLFSLLAFLILISIASAQTAPTLTIKAPNAPVDSSFDVTIAVSQISNLRGLEFVVDSSPSDAVFVESAETTGLLGSKTVPVNEDDGKVVVFSVVPIDASGDILILHFNAIGNPDDEVTISLKDVVLSTGSGMTTVTPTIQTDDVILSDCVVYPNTHSGSGVKIPDTNCACNSGTTLVASTSDFGDWACQAADPTVFGGHAVVCDEENDLDPIFDTGFCCEANYQLNQTFNNFNDFLGLENEACTEIPPRPPFANIFQPPEFATLGEKTNFSSRGSSDEDGEIVEYEWDFGDNKTKSNLANPTKIYRSLSDCPDSLCEVTLTVTDDDDLSDSVDIPVKLIGFEDAVLPDSVCGNGIVEDGEVCDGADAILCVTSSCLSDCSGCQAGQVTGIELDRTYTSAELALLGLSLGGDTTLPDGRIVTVDASGTVTDIRTGNAPSSTAICGNGVCDLGETVSTCLQDCHFGDGICQKGLGETSNTAPLDCPKSRTALFLTLFVVLALLGGGIFVAVKKGWLSMGPLGHKKQGGPSGGALFDLNRMAEHHGVTKPHNDFSKLTGYIKSTRAQGFSFSQIKSHLMQKGWKEDDINTAFSAAA